MLDSPDVGSSNLIQASTTPNVVDAGQSFAQGATSAQGPIANLFKASGPGTSFAGVDYDPGTIASLKRGFSPESISEGLKQSIPGSKARASYEGMKVGDALEGIKSIYRDPTKVKELIGPSSGYLLAEGADRGMKATKAFEERQEGIIAAREKKKKQYRDLAASLAKQYPFGYAQGGVANLSGRYLDGAGDGMSDSILANIEGQQEARLADGEFVVPADVVADMGNGSSNAGAERLYAMMDRIRQARHGTTKQPPEVNVNKVMPA